MAADPKQLKLVKNVGSQGIAFGLDRLVMLLAGTDNIRDVIAFPKTQSGADMMSQAPGPVDSSQLDELQLKVIEQPPA